MEAYAQRQQKLFYRSETLHPQVSRMFDDERSYQAESMKRILEQGQAEGVILQDCRCDIVGQLLSTKFDILFSLDEICTVEFTFMETFEMIFKTFIRGIATEKGLKIIERYFANTDFN